MKKNSDQPEQQPADKQTLVPDVPESASAEALLAQVETESAALANLAVLADEQAPEDRAADAAASEDAAGQSEEDISETQSLPEPPEEMAEEAYA
ncbi:MAG: hypothetical protein SO044_08200, partial [Agathobaculum sp.]|uniref:hypothetical protein n=1 Tax=Agathobaculum sp. TaxID=2048138 RepID=UPI002A7F248C